MARTSNRVLWENAVRVLEFVREESARNRDHIAPLSYRQIANGTGLSQQQARFLCGRLDESGLLMCTPRYAEDGGQLAKGYAVTSRGRMGLREARRLEAIL